MPSPSEAVLRAHEVENSVLRTASIGDRAISELRHFYHLPVCADGWVNELALCLSMNNKDYRRRIKTELQAASLRLHYLYARQPGQSNAFQTLNTQVTGMSEACQEAQRLYNQFKDLAEVTSRSGMPPHMRAFLQRSGGRLERGTAQLRETEALVRDRFHEWRVYFMVVCTKGNLDQLLDVLHESKIPQAFFVDKVIPLCKCLAELRDERLRITMSLTTTGLVDATAWTAANGHISERRLNARFMFYESYCRKIQKTNDDQVGILQSIQDLSDRAQTSPTTLRGPNSTELSVEKLLNVFSKYERICALSARALEAAHDEVLPALKAVLSELRAA